MTQLKQQLIAGVRLALYSVPLTLAFSCCADVNIGIGIMYTGLLLLASRFCGIEAVMPCAYALLPIIYAADRFGQAGVLITAVLSVVMLALLLRYAGKLLGGIPPAVRTLSCFILALCVTVMLTTDYFGIGAQSGTVFQMLREYRYLGFHGNWRGVLYGTVTLVIMITYPRKFGKLKNYLPAGAASVLVTLVMNLLLIREPSLNTISEASQAYNCIHYSFNGLLVPEVLGLVGLSFASALIAALLAVPHSGSQAGSRGEVLCVPRLQRMGENGTAVSLVSVLICVAVECLVLYAGAPVVKRIPLPTLAVIFIVSAWQEVEMRGFRGGWKWVKK